MICCIINPSSGSSRIEPTFIHSQLLVLSWPELPMNYSERTLARMIVILLTAAPMLTAAKTLQHEAHVHGIAELTVALEREYLEVVFISAAASIVGFEQRATTPEEVAAVAGAERALRSAGEILTFTGTECLPTSVLVDMSAVMESDNHDEHRDHAEPHSDINAEYKYNCNDTADLKSLRFGTDKLPFSLEKVNVRWVSERGQGAVVLTADKREIEFN